MSKESEIANNALNAEAIECKIADFPLFAKAVAIQAKKGEDYNNGSVKFEDYFIFGHKSYVHILYQKVLRLVSLVEKDGEANFEGIDDTLMDLVVYANQYAKDRMKGIVRE